MILFDLKCDDSHYFEGWFPDSKGFERQRKKQLIECPACGSCKIEKALMAPSVTTARKSEARAEAVAMQASSAMAKKMLGEMRKHVEENCEDVGPKFAEEARKIHYGETEQRDIYGQADKEEVADLKEEGVDFNLLPWVEQAKN
jgi:hypothetical protein